MIKRWLFTVATGLILCMPVARTLAQTEHAPAAENAPHVQVGEHKEPSLIPDPSSRETQLSALWIVIIFVVLLIVLYPTAWKGVLAGLKAREDRIRKDIADAEGTRAKAEATLQEYNKQLATAEQKVRELLSRATADGEQLASNIRAKAQEEAEQIKQRTARDLEAAKQQAVQEIHQYTTNLAVDVAQKILRRTLTADDQKKLVGSGLDQISSASKN
jgi:F-type H+-transporting ATPase subunit b